ncbi:hypothetical protein QBC45DRAFT_397016 [Copromyces sp. CBS 386.78]|nr:hypothetical protein QBC45DRAFT_397016 [Copromyces sp. CBS 386.78]
MGAAKSYGRKWPDFPRHSKSVSTNTTQTKLGSQGRHPVSLQEYCLIGTLLVLVLGALYRKASKSSKANRSKIKKKKKPGLTIKSRNSRILNKADLVKHLQTRNGTKLDEEPDLAQEELRNDMSTMTDTKLDGQGQYLPLFLLEYHLPMFLHEYLLVAIYLTLIIGGLSRLLEVFLPVFIR